MDIEVKAQYSYFMTGETGLLDDLRSNLEIGIKYRGQDRPVFGSFALSQPEPTNKRTSLRSVATLGHTTS